MTERLQLRPVTLLMIETREHTLARMSLEDSLARADFGDVLVLTDRPKEFESLDTHGAPLRIHTVEDWPEKVGWSRCLWYDTPPLLRTAFVLATQWDSWIWDTRQWTDEFYNYDYIGAPWGWHKDGKTVGNGGFSLVSTRLKRYIYKHRDKYPCDTPVDDDLYCRKYRVDLENKGFTWAPEKVAHQFAFECSRPTISSFHFGFHAMFNWSVVLPEDRLIERVKIAMQSDYITNPTGVIWSAFVQRHPDLVDRLLLEASKDLIGAKHG